MKNRTMLATGLLVLAVGATTTGAVAASRDGAPRPAPAPAAAEAPATTPAPAAKPRRNARPAPKRRAQPKPVPRRSRLQEAAPARGSSLPASMDPDRNPHYERDLNEWVDCMNERGLRTIATMTGITAGGWTYGEPRTARERRLLSEDGWDEARAIELACQDQAFS